eukprot:12095-Heterococcus_DN1.PRE.1
MPSVVRTAVVAAAAAPRTRLSAAMFKYADVLKLVVHLLTQPLHASSFSNTLQSCQPTQSECTSCLE